MAANTNAYAAKQLEESRQSGESGGGRWEEVVPEELGLWLGIVLYMGVCSAPAVKDDWSHNSLTAIHPIRDYMSQTRFEQIKRYYHVATMDAPTHAAIGHRLWNSKVDPLLDQWRYGSQHYRMPSTHTAIDECMIRATGRSQDTYKMPSKPIQQGFKFHYLADHGYIWDFHLTSNQAGPDPVPPIEGLTATGAVVYHLLQKLP